MRRAAALGFTLACVIASGAPAQSSGTRAAAPAADAVTHDNRDPAGTVTGKVLKVRLEAVRATWRPEGADGPVRDVYAFAVEGGAPNIPGPLIRVPAGTEIHMFVRNRLPVPLKLHGVGPRPLAKDQFVTMVPGKGLEFRFKAGAPGTYYYWGQTGDSAFAQRSGADGQLTGALIIDAPGADPNADRVFVISEWLGPLPPPGTPRKLSIAVNGRSWPHTERLLVPFGLPVEWRVINGSVAPHPMHLHGTFYTVESRGTALRDVIYGTPSRRLVTTELMTPGTTMTMRWVPDRVGNWLFHCHILAHVTGRMRDGDRAGPMEDAHAEHDPAKAMAGLVLGIVVQPGDETAAPDLAPHARRRLSLDVREIPGRYGPNAGIGFALSNDSAASDVVTNPSPPIILRKDEPVVIGVKNGIHESFAIHWHGLELESFNDGVPGWSGQSGRIMPPVEPDKTFDVNFTPPRAGTFMYHTHGHDSRQLVSGMYGALVVLEPGAKFDPAVDHIVLLGGAGPPPTPGVPPGVEINRSTKPGPMQIKAGVKHRFRIINITPNFTLAVSLRGESGPVQWKAIAKDGADLPPNQATTRAATLTIGVGETYDFEYEPSGAGDLRIDVSRIAAGNAIAVATQPIRVVR